MSNFAAGSHLSDMSHRGKAGHSSISPASVNYITANTKAAVKPNSQPKPTPQPAATQAPANKCSKRSQLRSKVKKTFTSVRKSLKTISSLVFSGGNRSSSSLGSRDSYQKQVRVSFLSISGTSTPSICLTKPTYRGSNVRLSLHMAAPTPGMPQTSSLNETELPQNGSGRANRKSTRFHHPVVSGVITDCGILEETSIPTLGESILDSGNTRPGTASTIGSTEFENQVNPKRIFRNSHMASNAEKFEAFKNVMDGVRIRSPPRAAAEAQPPVATTAPSLPYIAVVPSTTIEISEATSHPNVAQSTEQEVSTTTSTVPIVLVVPSVLAPGSEQPLPQPRARPHTTNELLPGTNFLPYLPYIPRFNPYSATTTAPNTPNPTPTIQEESSARYLAAAFAEAETAEQAAIHQRHTTLYAAVESGSLTSLVARPTALTSTAAAATTTANAPSSTAFTIKRKPVPQRLEAPKPCTSKPLPALPAPGSPRRFTYGIVPAALQKDKKGYPLPKKLLPAPKKCWWRIK